MKTFLSITALIFLVSFQALAQRPKKLIGKNLPSEVAAAKLFRPTGESTTLKEVVENHKGKAIYIDFWASWCAPCLAEMPHSFALQKKFAGREIVFLYLSTDEEDENWQRGLKKIQKIRQKELPDSIAVVQAHYRIDTDSKPPIQQAFRIRGIPFYLLLDKGGKIVDPAAPWPREKEIRGMLKKEIEKE